MWLLKTPMNSAWRQVKGKMSGGKAKDFFLSIRESRGGTWGDKDRAALVGELQWQDKALFDSCEIEKQMRRGERGIMACDSKYSGVLSLLGWCHWCHVCSFLKLIWDFRRCGKKAVWSKSAVPNRFCTKDRSADISCYRGPVILRHCWRIIQFFK